MTSESSSFMLAEQQVKNLKTRIQESIDVAHRKARQNKQKASAIKIASLSLSAAVTILIGWKSGELRETINNIALAFAAMVTLLSALEPFFNYRALWIEHEEAVWRFYTIRDDLEFYLAGRDLSEIDQGELSAFHARIGSTWDELSRNWLRFRRAETTSKADKVSNKKMEDTKTSRISNKET